jgi:hypothetical protein
VVYPDSTFCPNQPYVVEVGFGESKGEIVVGLNIEFIINGKIFLATTNQDGKASYSYIPSTGETSISVYARYGGGPAVRGVQSTTRISSRSISCAGPAAQSALTIANTTLTGVAGTAITLSASGGSGSGAITFTTVGTGCAISTTSLTASTATTCVVTATKAANGIYASANSPTKSIAFLARP